LEWSKPLVPLAQAFKVLRQKDSNKKYSSILKRHKKFMISNMDPKDGANADQ